MDRASWPGTSLKSLVGAPDNADAKSAIGKAGSPVTRFTLERRNRHDDNFILMRDLDDRKRKFLRQHPPCAVFEGSPGFRRPACKCFHLLDGFVEPFTELTADGRIKTDLMQEFKPRVFVIANRPHR